jgi:FKBP-type peptidyl-prolyl cis-trans isomerase 2
MTQARQNDTVRIHFRAKLEDGTLFETSVNDNPIQFTIGEGDVINGLEKAVEGMKPGESKTVVLDPEAAYGPRSPQRVRRIERDNLPAQITPKVGQPLDIEDEEDGRIQGRITDVSLDSIEVDANHPLAGKNLIYDIRLVEIV